MALFSSVSATANLIRVKKISIEKPEGGREFKNYVTYKAYVESIGLTARPKNNWFGQDGYWQQSERENAWLGWRNAVYFITYHKSPYYLKPFGQIMAYYKQVYIFTRNKKHESRWLKGAFYLVEDLWEAYEDGLTPANCVSANEVIALLKKLNQLIANYAITKFNELLITKYKNNPRTGINAYIYDRDFIVHEQGFVAYPAYLATYNNAPDGPKALKEMSRVYNDQIINEGVSLSTILKRMDGSGIFIPVYGQYYAANLADFASNFGQESRVQVPLAMLYPDKYFMYDTDPNKFLNEKQENDLNNAIPKEPAPQGSVPYPKKTLRNNFRLALQEGSKHYYRYNQTNSGAYTDESILFAIHLTVNKRIMKIFDK